MKYVVLRLISGYQKIAKYLKTKSCRFEPTCSQFMKDAIRKYGLGKGFIKGISRLARCHQFSSGGYDPVT